MCTPDETFAKVSPLFDQYGITRLSDITWLDWIGLHVYNAVVPRSAEDVSVYTGKGMTKTASKVSAIMEAIERNVGLLPLQPAVTTSYNRLAAEGRDAVRPGELNLELAPGYTDDAPTPWVVGHDVVAGRDVLVPHSAVSLASAPGTMRCYRLITANGLASGNCIEEAICHALAEVIERDAQTFAELLCSRLPHMLATGAVKARARAEAIAELQTTCPRIDIATLPPSAKQVADMFEAAGVHLQLCSLTSIGVPVVMAISHDTTGYMSHAHVGMGAGPDAEIAAVRAITECAQSRAVDIQSMREDFVPADATHQRAQVYGKRVTAIDTASWPWQTGGKTIALADEPTFTSDDVAADLGFMLDRLAAAGLSRVIAVDLSPPELPVKVARVIVPGIESWGSDRSKVGPRATRAFNQALQKAKIS